MEIQRRAIHTCLPIKVFFGLAIRHTTNFFEKSTEAHRAGLGGTGLKHHLPTPKNAYGEHSISGRERPAAPSESTLLLRS